ncbi:MAG TPA: sigma-70 family RNA polymerase sigma factor [Candidatus Angelobacter sp.]|jgi:RNA polymerase sigma-70 factor (ECF subfamily)|nr:sigma-70 family RNA polymerase sigma factor [Candidatus Angelobacter sp.]
MTLEFADPILGGGASLRQRDRYYSAHYLAILRYCVRQLADHNDAEDATQETFRRAIQQGIGEVDDPLPWLLTVARNVCVDELRRRRSGRTALERTAAAQGSAPEADGESCGNPEPVVVGRMFVDELLGRLTPAERRVVAGKVIAGQSGGELAASMGVTASTTRVLLARAREKMRRYIEDAHGVAGGVCVGGWQAMHGARRRLMGWSAALQPRAELLLPALVVTAMVAPGAGAAAALPTTGTAGLSRDLLTARNLDPSDLVAGRSSSLASGAITAAALGDSTARASQQSVPAPAHAGSPIDPLLPPPNPDEVWTTDFAPSPNYQNDHTVYMVGDGNCYVTCGQLFRSSDGGATWTYVTTNGLASDRLLIPPSSYGSGRFYGTGGSLLQVTTDWGSNFKADGPAPAFAAVAPGWLGAQVVTADATLSFVDGSPVPRVVAAFGPGLTAAGSPVLLPSPSGWSALQVLQNPVTTDPDTLLSCSATGCVARGQVPFTGPVQLLASPSFATDHTLVALGPGAAISHDGGATFTVVSTTSLSDAVLVPLPGGGVRLVAVQATYDPRSDYVLAYSDNWGTTWTRAGLARGLQGGLYVHTPRMLAPGRLIASAADPRHPGMHVFVCSADGATWSGCASS